MYLFTHKFEHYNFFFKEVICHGYPLCRSTINEKTDKIWHIKHINVYHIIAELSGRKKVWFEKHAQTESI